MSEPTNHELHRQLAIAVEALRSACDGGRLALEVMHEINNPLEALFHLTFSTLEESDDPEKVRGYMLEAKEQMAQLREIASQTLALQGRPGCQKQVIWRRWPRLQSAFTKNNL
jgi:hypothetical protein